MHRPNLWRRLRICGCTKRQRDLGEAERAAAIGSSSGHNISAAAKRDAGVGFGGALQCDRRVCRQVVANGACVGTGSNVSVGVVGGVVSITTLSAVEAVLTLPARSVAVAVMLCVPAASAEARDGDAEGPGGRHPFGRCRRSPAS